MKLNIIPFSNYAEPHSLVRTLSKGYAAFLAFALGLVPAAVVAYLYFFQHPALWFEHHGIHELAIALALLQSGFIAYVTYCCYLRSKEPFLLWLTLAFLGFTIIYGLHGVFTRLSHEHHMLFILYGPASRLVMAVCLLVGLITYGRQDEQFDPVPGLRFWLSCTGIFVAIAVLIMPLAFSDWAALAREWMELAAMCIMLAGALLIVVRRIRSPLMTVYALSLVIFTQASFAFILGPAWSHMWWLAHAVFAIGFMALSYGVVQGFLTTGSFSRVYSQAELVEQLRTEKARADEAVLKLQQANEELEVIAATDPLTGCANRRGLETRSKMEIAGAERNGTSLSLITIDFDYFKQINDRHGHSVGEKVLVAFAGLVKNILRPSDLLARTGGEEFAILLPETSLDEAVTLAERLRKLTATESFTFAGINTPFTLSIGVAQFGPDGDTYKSVTDVADQRMYRAKRTGRNRVIAE